MTMEFPTLTDLAEHLAGVAVADIELASRHSLNDAANLLKRDMRAQIGVSQPGVGAYPEWAPLAQSTIDEKQRLGVSPLAGMDDDAPLYREGDLLHSFRSDVISNHEAIIGSTDPVMEYHEFGTSKMPPRPVVGPSLFKNIETIKQIVGGDARAVIAGQSIGYRFSEQTGIPDLGE